MFTLSSACASPSRCGLLMAEPALWSVVMAWFYARSGEPAVAIAVHAGAHLDNVTRAPDSEVRLRALRFVLGGVAAGADGAGADGGEDEATLKHRLVEVSFVPNGYGIVGRSGPRGGGATAWRRASRRGRDEQLEAGRRARP